MNVRAVIGLGNPGVRYASTRHNLGFRVSNALLTADGGSWSPETPLLRWGRGRRGTVVIQPLTMMNRSGEAVRAAVRQFRLEPDALVVVCDDLDLPLGRLRLRPAGGDGGHLGLASVAGALGTDDFGRLRLGTGRPPDGVEPADYVLTPFTREEEPVVAQTVSAAVDCLMLLLTEGYEAAMNRYNGWQAEGTRERA